METPTRRSSRCGTRVAAALAQQVICDLVSYDEVATIAEEADDEEDERNYRYHLLHHSRSDKSSYPTDFTTTIKPIKSTKHVNSSPPSNDLQSNRKDHSKTGRTPTSTTTIKSESNSTTITPVTLSSTPTEGSGQSEPIDIDNSKLQLSTSIVIDENQSTSTTIESNLYSAYQTWALKTYGDSAKTKTVTRKKYQRIVRILRGEETTNVENSKFRFWVKAKGFKLRGNVNCKQESATIKIEDNHEDEDENILLVPCTKTSSGNLTNSVDGKSDETVYKKVAVVENFYNIIYNVHVEMDGRSGKHAGQKRTYRAVAEMFAFLPREAVTRFLMSCSDCQKRMHLQGINTSSTGNHQHQNHLSSSSSPLSSSNSYQKKSSRRSTNSITSLKPIRKSDGNSNRNHNQNEMDFSLPITATYLKRMKSLGYNDLNNNHIEHGIFPYIVNCDQPTPFNHHQNLSSTSLSPIQNVQMNGATDEPISGSEYNSEISVDSNDAVNGTCRLDVDDSQVEGSREESNQKSYNNDQLIVANCKSPSSLTTVTMGEVDPIETHDPSGPLDMSKMSRRSSSPEPSPNYSALTASDSPPQIIPPTINSSPSLLVIKSRSPLPKGNSIKRKASVSPKGLSSSKDSTDSSRPEKMAALSNGIDEMTPTSDYTLKEEEEDEDDDEEVDIKMDEKTDTNNFDPERLKAFNMFVRLFVDENLDRMVPISRQPKDKIQAIIESCMRQFPEFSDRARKRIRTYLKSCRRTRRHKTPTVSTQSPTNSLVSGNSKDGSNSNGSRMNSTITSISSSPTSSVYHLTSPIAEQILASACANESYNAKRMRAGLKPLPGRSISPSNRDSSRDQFVTYPETQTFNDNLGSILPSTTSPSSESAVQVLKPNASSSLNSTLLAALTGHPKNESGDNNRSDCMEPLMLLNKKEANLSRCDEFENVSRQVNQSNSIVNGNGPVSHTPPTSMVPLSSSSQSFSSSSPGSGSIINGISNNMSNSAGGPSHHQSSSQHQGGNSSYLPYTYLLSPGETAAIKTLIAGYRESAAFLLRSANELEHLLLQQT